MSIDQTKKRVERALVELQYFAADFLFDAKGQFADEQSRRVASYYQSACIALNICLDAIEQADAEKDTIQAA